MTFYVKIWKNIENSHFFNLKNYNFYNENNGTVGVNFVSKYIENTKYKNDVIKFQIWDTAGQERFRSIIRTYYRCVCGCIIAYDITNKESLDNCIYWIDEVRRNNGDIKMILLGTKTDLDHMRQVSYDEGLKLSKCYNIPFFEVSSRGNVDEVFEKLIELVMEYVKSNNNVSTEILNNDSMDNINIQGVVEIDNFEKYNHINNNRNRQQLLSYLRCCNN